MREEYEKALNAPGLFGLLTADPKAGVVRFFRRDEHLLSCFGAFQEEIADAVGAALLYLVPKWDHESVPISENNQSGPAGPSLKLDSVDEKVRVAEHFVCIHYVNFMSLVIGRIRSSVLAIGGMYVLSLLALNVYPFEPKVIISGLMAILFVYITAVVALVYADMHRDTTLSYMTDTTPGELGADFWVRMSSFVAVPLFGLAATVFPEFNQFLFSWVEPALQAMK